MKLKTTLLIIALSPISVFAQWSASVGTNQGYEWNIFKNPELLVQSSDTLERAEMWQNSTYNESFINLDKILPLENGRFKLSADLSNNYYFQQREAQKIFFKLKGSYRVKYARRKYFEIDPSFSRRVQDGVDQSDLVFSTRLSYQQLEIPVHADFYLGNKAWLRFDFRFRNRAYDEFQDRQTIYRSYFVQSEYKKRWEGDAGWEKSIMLESSVEYRDQQIENIVEPFDVINSRQFLITKVKATPSIGKISDRVKFSIPIQFDSYRDQPTNSLNYIGWSAAFELDSELERSGFSIEAKYGNRQFKNFTLDSGELLHYTNWMLSGTAQFELTPFLEFQIKAKYLLRDSSRDRLTTAAYRGYQTSYIQTGFKVKL